VELGKKLHHTHKNYYKNVSYICTQETYIVKHSLHTHPQNHISLLSQMKLLETPTTASLTKSDNEKPLIQKYRLTKLKQLNTKKYTPQPKKLKFPKYINFGTNTSSCPLLIFFNIKYLRALELTSDD